jgi:hypothetical protein
MNTGKYIRGLSLIDLIYAGSFAFARRVDGIHQESGEFEKRSLQRPIAKALKRDQNYYKNIIATH